MATSVELTLVDVESNMEYEIIVSNEDAKKARIDINFATLLLEQVKKNSIRQLVNTQYATNTQVATNKRKANTNNESIPNAMLRNSTDECTEVSANTSSTSNTSANEIRMEASTSSAKSNSDECMEGTHLWTKEETLLLLNIYDERKDKFGNGMYTMKKCWQIIANAMQEKGYKVTSLKCSTKLQALKRTYKSIVDHNNKSGNNPKKWEYFKIMQELFADKPWVQPLSVAGSHMTEIEEKRKLKHIPKEERLILLKNTYHTTRNNKKTSKKFGKNIMMKNWLLFNE
ncbi:PREDICTED: uncharacterized protein LOC105448082 [Wasmannia auropunctata]|uniref:uncharacterized protein LOC105448082 n=1 Tax=Wasmannia auropunctata TaxID=64793 RepID=UPI0005EEB053|nr:PREDICTED: uncharacterized protein LOC105448082 [Wasmannia auropunctata]